MLPWWLAAGLAVITHAVLLAIVSRLARPPAPLAVEEAGIPLVFQAVQPLAAASLSPVAGLAPRLGPPAGLTIVAGHVAAPAVLRRDAAAANTMPAVRSKPDRRQATRGISAPAPGVLSPTQGLSASAPPKIKADAEGSALLPALEACIDEAVHQAARMPEAARRQHRQGSARVEFTYVDGRVNGVKLVAPSQSRVLDDAALQAVSRAVYPLPPEALRGRVLDLLVWVNFRLDA